MLSSHLVRTKLSLHVLRRGGAALSLWGQLVPNPMPLMCFNRVRNVTTLETCVYLAKSRPTQRSRRALGQVKPRASCRMKRTSISVKSGPTQRSRRAFYSGRIVAFAPHQAGFSFGQNGTDAALQARVYSGRIVASRRVKWASSSVKSGAMRRSRRAFTQAESWPRAASSGLRLRT
jgi:hypothetical protein